MSATELLTIRDHLRYAVSRFCAAGLVFGHGTASALDEAAFLILESLSLPIDTLEPWLDCRLTGGERSKLLALFEARIATRKPAAYLMGAAYIQGHRFVIDESVIVPRSFIGELIAGEESPALPLANPHPLRILDLCTGSGCLAILAALAFENATIDAVDISLPALEVAARNVADYGLAGRITLRDGDLFAPIAGERYDLIIANPPYVTAAGVQAFPPEYAAEPVLAHAGGVDGLDIVRRILAGAGGHLTRDGTLIVEVGQAREALEASYPALTFLWLDTAASAGEVFSLHAGELTAIPRKGKRSARD